MAAAYANNSVKLSLIFVLLFVESACASDQATPRKHKIQSWNTLKWQNIERQGYDYSCGAAALATLAQGYFGDPIDEPLALEMLLTNITSQEEIADRIVNGFSMLDLQQTAYRFGYDAIGVKLPNDAVFKLNGPIIVIMRDEEVEHFVVLKGVDHDNVYLADSFRGNIRMPLQVFFDQWSGTALILGKKGRAYAVIIF